MGCTFKGRPICKILSVAIVTAVAVLLSAGISLAASAKLQWDANTESTLKGYKIYYKTGTSGPPYNGSGASQGSSPITVSLKNLADAAHPEFSLTNLNDGKTYYFSVTAYSDTAESGYSSEVALQAGTLSGSVIDNADAGFSTVGTWTTSSSYPGYYGDNYRYAAAGAGSKKATWTFQAGSPGQYSIAAQWAASATGRSTQAPYTIYNNGAKVKTVLANQQINGGHFNELGTYQLNTGSVKVVLSNDVPSQHVCADAVQLAYVGGSSSSSACTLDSRFDGSSLYNNIAYYTDRGYTLTSVPSEYVGMDLIKTPNADRNLTTASGYLTFGLNSSATVYVAFDSRATSLPNWMSGFSDTGKKIYTSLSTQPYLKVYSRSYSGGACVSLGANRASGFAGGTVSNYIVFY